MTERLITPEIENNKKYALISVFNKAGIVYFAKTLDFLGYKIISTGGTAKTLAESGLSVVPIQEITGNPESFDGRMKTISFQIESGILFDRANPSHVNEARNLKIPRIDIVVCNLYPFEEIIAKPDVAMAEAIENIDIGGPTMLRAAAKNYNNVLVVTTPSDYAHVAQALQNGKISEELRRELAAKAFRHTAFYDAQIARYFNKEKFPKELTLPLRKKNDLRYGDNPDQKAVLYLEPNTKATLANLLRHAGREPSATNITDLDAGIKSVSLFETPAAVVIKHNSPCGIALGETPAEALERALEADPESAFGGVVVLNRPMTLEAAQKIDAFKESGKGQMDVIAATSIDYETLDFIKKIRKSTGIYTLGEIPKNPENKMSVRFIDGGAIVQTENNPETSFDKWKVVTEVQPTHQQLEQMKIAWKFISRIRSNTVAVIDKDLPMTRGIGTGQTSRVLATQIALERAGDHSHYGILASDSFFPFPDSVRLAAMAGIVAIIQQGGSVNDQASIDEANKFGITMVMTGQRLFWH